MRFAPVTRLIERQVLFLLVRPLGLGTGTALTSLRIMGHKYMTTCAERGRDRAHSSVVLLFFSNFPFFLSTDPPKTNHFVNKLKLNLK